jgi:large subunit ribosomal protein L7/L12
MDAYLASNQEDGDHNLGGVLTASMFFVGKAKSMDTQAQPPSNGNGTVAVAADYPDNIRAIGDKIASLLPAEAQELNDYLEVTYNIVPPPKPVAWDQPEPEPEVDECTAYGVVLQSYGEKKINVIKTVRKIMGLTLIEARDFVNGVPKTVQENLSKEEAEALKQELEEAGGVAILG